MTPYALCAVWTVGSASASGAVALDRMAEALGLRVQSEAVTHRQILTGHGNRVVLCPGFYHALVNGRVQRLDSPACYRRGEVEIPRAFFDWLRKELSQVPHGREEPRPRAAVPSVPGRRPKIMIDPGHGGKDPGAVRKRLTEKFINLDVALRLKPMLEKAGCDVVMTRTTDVYIHLHERVAWTNHAKADVFLSIHANAAHRRSASGFETFYVGATRDTEDKGLAHLAAVFDAASLGRIGRGDALVEKILVRALYEDRRRQSKFLAECIQRGLSTHLTARNRGAKKDPRGLCVLRGVTCPRALVEVGFLSNDQERRLLNLVWYRKRVARALAAGILEFVAAQRQWRKQPAH